MLAAEQLDLPDDLRAGEGLRAAGGEQGPQGEDAAAILDIFVLDRPAHCGYAEGQRLRRVCQGQGQARRGGQQAVRLNLYGVGGDGQQGTAALPECEEKAPGLGQLFLDVLPVLLAADPGQAKVLGVQEGEGRLVDQRDLQPAVLPPDRSEERRVGKECL